MATQETKRQHFVHRGYMKRFSHQKGTEYFIHALPKSHDPKESSIFESNIIKVALQKDLYTLPGETKEERQLLEDFYAENIESRYDLIYQLLTDPSKKTVTQEERDLIISTVVTMFYRTTKWISTHNEFMERGLTHVYNLSKSLGKDHFTFEGTKVSIEGKTAKQLAEGFKLEHRPNQVISQLDIAMRLIKIRSKSDGIMVIKLGDQEHNFITSDNPVSYHKPGEKQVMPFDPKNILSVALDPKHLLMLMPYADEETKNIIVRTTFEGNSAYSQKLTSNYAQWENSERFLLGSKDALVNYLSTKEETERPFTEEELKSKASAINKLELLLKQVKDLGLI